MENNVVLKKHRLIMIIIIIAFDILVSVYTKRNCRNDVGNGLITIFGPLQSSLS